ncbi:P1 family peptidase [Asticcacaulis sp.]|uniref:P1 family peptidase n=1 Tax=Asticcacaulis sp. TaxID=1872648 RepID=UPI002B5AECA5|nr:P1 family peptidase [Asticcacaulis sp.]HTM81406.1 P1 family peptidase [Asticcacaulis sp.]
MLKVATCLSALLAGAMLLTPAFAADAPVPPDSQANLKPVLNAGGKALTFDWPMLSIGTGEYSEGPTGVTVFRFGRKVLGAVDVRGGGPGTVNTEYLNLHYNVPEVNAVVLSGGSWYGLETATAVGTALKDDGFNTGNWDSVAMSVGSIIYDYGPRRLNEIYPDKKLAQAAFRAAVPGIFRNGSAGAGRMAETGDFFGCQAHSGQGGAFRQIGDLKIAAFTVVNAYGVVTNRDGTIAACNNDPSWPKGVTVTDLMHNLPESRKAGWDTISGPKRNTTISLIVVNQKMDPAELQRLAVQVHTSMARGIQPFASMGDGDVLYAISTGEIDAPDGLINPELGALISDVMWDAILNSVPEQPAQPAPVAVAPVSEKTLKTYSGDYRFSSFVTVKVTNEGGKLYAQATGQRKAFAIATDAKTELQPLDNGEYFVPGRYPLVLSFKTPGELVINPGQWRQTGKRQ